MVRCLLALSLKFKDVLILCFVFFVLFVALIYYLYFFVYFAPFYLFLFQPLSLTYLPLVQCLFVFVRRMHT